MNIIIAGAGKVGFNLARNLCVGNNVTIIDKNQEALHRIEENLDILPVSGEIENPMTYKGILQKDIDLFIAVTNVDALNIVSTVIVDDVLNVKRKFIRLQNHFYTHTSMQKKLNIDKIIFPLKLASAAIASLLHYPKANNVKFFKYTQHKLISLRASKDIRPFIANEEAFAVVGIERDKKFFINKDSTQILPNDLVYCFGLKNDIEIFCNKLDYSVVNQTKRCVVFGGDELGISIAKELLETTKNVKLIEKDIKLCEIADEQLEGRASVINSKYSTSDIFEQEGLEDADIFIAATNNDEFNIIKCLEAQERGIPKVVAINNEMQYYNLMHSLGIIVVRGPKMSAYNTIIEHIGSTGVVIQKSFCGAKANVFMRRIFPSSKLINKKLKPLNTQNSSIFYIRDEKIYPFKENLSIMQNDIIVAFCTSLESPKIKHWIYGL